MDPRRASALALAAMELLPAEPSDLSGLLADPAQLRALLALTADERSTHLTRYLCAEIDHGRVELWEKRLDHYTADEDADWPILYGTETYPLLLANCWDRPPILFVQGRLQAHGPSVAIVGSRQASEDVVASAYEVASVLASSGVSVVSGLADGVDTSAHIGALNAGGHTVAVFGTGINEVFPERNRELARHIRVSGAVVSQFAPTAPRTSTTFLRRNSVIAGLSHVSVVMDGRERSGSRHQAEQAVRYGRDVLLWGPALRAESWARAMADSGQASFVDSSCDVLLAAGQH